MMHCGTRALALSGLLGLLAAPVRANLVITPTFDSSITHDPNASTIEGTINSAIGVYEQDFVNPITVSIDFSEMSTGLGQSLTGFYGTTYDSYRTQLLLDKGTDDADILANLPASGNPVPGNGTAGVAATSADLRALGYDAPALVTVNGVNYDSQISLNTSLMNLSRSSVKPDKYDLSAVASHEIDEALGLYSSLDGLGNGVTDPIVLKPDATNRTYVGSLDFFRYSAPGVRSFTNKSTASSYFSVNSGQSVIVYFNQNGGGDFHDWKSQAGTPRVQDAFGTPGSTPNLGPAELTALQDVGYNEASPAPEPSSPPVLAMTGALLGGALWRGHRRRSRCGAA